MNGERPPVAATALVLTAGTAAAAAALAAAPASPSKKAAGLGALLSTAGVVALLATPAVGLVVSFFEMRRLQPRAALLALVVLSVLALSVAVALLTRH